MGAVGTTDERAARMDDGRIAATVVFYICVLLGCILSAQRCMYDSMLLSICSANELCVVINLFYD